MKTTSEIILEIERMAESNEKLYREKIPTTERGSYTNGYWRGYCLGTGDTISNLLEWIKETPKAKEEG